MFLAEAKAEGMVELQGHRLVGGCRASIYNAFPTEGAKALADFMTAFAAKNG
jgi:phosphoserine aminotransferase